MDGCGSCAQRLAASTVGKQYNPGDRRPVKFVLNALRHQRLGNHPLVEQINKSERCSTPCGINGWETRLDPRPQNDLELCSTPCGINGWETFVVNIALHPTRVLNALRHQRLGN